MDDFKVLLVKTGYGESMGIPTGLSVVIWDGYGPLQPRVLVTFLKIDS